jgi:hypothetical protein
MFTRILCISVCVVAQVAAFLPVGPMGASAPALRGAVCGTSPATCHVSDGGKELLYLESQRQAAKTHLAAVPHAFQHATCAFPG